jgi:hypothetical protein
MKKLSVTYHAPKNDSKVVEIWGHTFYDSKAEEVTVDDDTYKTMAQNRFFECGKASDVTSQEAEKKPEPHEADRHRGH